MAAKAEWIVSAVLVVCAACAGAETLTLFDAKAPKEDLPPPAGWSAEGGATVAVGTEGVEAGFPADKDSAVTFNIPRKDSGFTGNIPSEFYKKGFSFLKIASEPCIWSGYSELVIECRNTGKEDLKLDLRIEDLATVVVGTYPRNWVRQQKDEPQELAKKQITAAMVQDLDRTWQGQMHVSEVTLKPGDNTLRLRIDGKLPTADGRRFLNTHEIWSVGLRRKAADGAAAVRIGKVWLDGGKAEATGLAGMWPKDGTKCVGYAHPVGWYVRMGTLGFNDPNAPFCPFCGQRLTMTRLHTEPALEADDGLKIYPSADAVVQGDSGGGTPALTVTNNDEGFHLAYYPEYAWDFRGFMRFDLSAVPRGAHIKTAQIRLYHVERERLKENVCVINGVPTYYKPYVPPLQIYQVDDDHAAWDEKTVNWLTQPPSGRLLVHGGLYNNPDTVEWFSYDLTSHVKERLADGKPSVNLSLRVMSPAPGFRGNLHYWGHHVNFIARESPRRDRCTHLYIELDKESK